MRRRLRAGATAMGTVAAGSIMLTACGTQLPDSRFRPALVVATVAAGPGAPQSSPGAGPTISAGPTEGAPGPTGSGPSEVVVTPTLPAGVVAGPSDTSRTAAATSRPGAKSSHAAAPTAAAHLGASDVGVTATTITMGNIVSAGGIFGTEEFGSTVRGVRAYFADLNSRGGIDGRKVQLNLYNDNGDGSQNTAAVKQAIADRDFALVGNNIYQYSGISLASAADLIDVGGQPIDFSYYKYPHMYTVLGYQGPQDGQNEGYDNRYYKSPDSANYFVQQLGAKNVGVVYYDGTSSKPAASFALAYSKLGVKTKLYPVAIGLPNFPNAVAQMQSDGVDVVADAMDANGNAKLCQAMESNSTFLAQVKAKVSSIAEWSQRVPSEFAQTPKCRSLLYAFGTSLPYSLTSNPQVAEFRAAMAKYFPSQGKLLSQWTYEGWLAGQLFTEAATSCGANLTRKCVETYLQAPGRTFTLQGQTAPFAFTPLPESAFQGQSHNGCYSIGHWSDAAQTFQSVFASGFACTPSAYYEYDVS